jgi:hypothetical protein
VPRPWGGNVYLPQFPEEGTGHLPGWLGVCTKWRATPDKVSGATTVLAQQAQRRMCCAVAFQLTKRSGFAEAGQLLGRPLPFTDTRLSSTDSRMNRNSTVYVYIYIAA